MELHAIEYEGIPIEYELIRKDVKYINLRVNKHGQVVVSAAKRVPFSVIEEFVQSKALWIINHLAEVEKIRMAQPSGAMYDGKTLYYLGEPYTLHIAQGLRQIQRSDNIIYMSTFQTDSVGLRSEYLEWLREQAAGTFTKLLDESKRLWHSLSQNSGAEHAEHLGQLYRGNPKHPPESPADEGRPGLYPSGHLP